MAQRPVSGDNARNLLDARAVGSVGGCPNSDPGRYVSAPTGKTQPAQTVVVKLTNADRRARMTKFDYNKVNPDSLVSGMLPLAR